jgi:hypothetical protein
MKALALRPHWAWFAVNGYKDIENRSWATRLRGRIWIHNWPPSKIRLRSPPTQE